MISLEPTFTLYLKVYLFSFKHTILSLPLTVGEIWENWQIYKSEHGSAMEKTVILLVLAEYIAFILLFIDYSLITLAQFLSSLTGRCFFSLHGLHFGALVP